MTGGASRDPEVARIRRAGEADRPIIARLHAASWRDAYRSILPADLLGERIDAIMAERWASQPIGPADAVLVAERDGVVSGFAATWDGKPAYIDNLHVAAGGRSRGLGRRLLAETARHFLGMGRRSGLLHVVVGNARARDLYLSLGGRPDGIEDKNLYGTIVPNERIAWPDLRVLLERATAG